MGFEWDERKAETNFQDHKVRFAESLSAFEDDHAITVTDEESDPHEQRFVALGMGTKGRVLVVVYCYRDQNIRIISRRARPSHWRAPASTRKTDEEAIRLQQGQAGAGFCRRSRSRKGKTRITIRLDEDLIDYFLKEADKSGGTIGYQTLINDALRQFVEGQAPKIEETLRRIVREEIRAAS